MLVLARSPLPPLSQTLHALFSDTESDDADTTPCDLPPPPLLPSVLSIEREVSDETMIQEIKYSMRSPPHMSIFCRAGMLPPRAAQKRLTLVLDLDQTLLFTSLDADLGGTMYVPNGYTLFRPEVSVFLQRASRIAELIVYSAGEWGYVWAMVHALDPTGKFIDYVLSRDNTFNTATGYIKHLGALDRPIDSVMMIDDIPQNVRPRGYTIHTPAFCGKEVCDGFFDEVLYTLRKAKTIGTRKAVAEYAQPL